MLQCPKCGSSHIRKNGKRRDKQNHICVDCGRQFIDKYDPPRGYKPEIKEQCLKMYVNGNGFRQIERISGVHHTTVINWVKTIGKSLPDTIPPDVIPDVGELDELETFVRRKKDKIWIWTAVDHFKEGIIAWVIGDHSSETFAPLWAIVEAWKCFFYVSDGLKVYPKFIPDEDHIVSKTYMTRVEGENTRLRHYLARLHRKTLCYSKSIDMLKYSVRLLIHYLKSKRIPMNCFSS